jgi:polyisoprenoid-binding protein YceI
MKKIIGVGIVVVIIIVALWIFRDDAVAPEQITLDRQSEQVDTDTVVDGTYSVDTEASSFRWEGNKPLVPGYVDAGTVAIKSGAFTIVDGDIIDGEFTIDMTGISTESTGSGGGEARLTQHLQSADFFEVETYPTTTFVVTGSQPQSNPPAVIGDLAIKGNTEQVTIPYVLAERGGQIVFVGRTTVDRTEFGITFGSGSFFDNLGDNIIADTFDVEYELVLERE